MGFAGGVADVQVVEPDRVHEYGVAVEGPCGLYLKETQQHFAKILRVPVDADVAPVPVQVDIAGEFRAADFAEFRVDVVAGGGVGVEVEVPHVRSPDGNAEAVRVEREVVGQAEVDAAGLEPREVDVRCPPCAGSRSCRTGPMPGRRCA